MISLVNTSHRNVDPTLQRDVAVLSALAHLGWLTTEQLHALCCPSAMLSTVRTTLRYFREAGWIHTARWRIRGCHGSHLWAITAKGHVMVERYLPIAVPYRPLDFGRPSTALEHEEYRLQLLLRSFIVQLILDARQTACLAELGVTLHQLATSASASCQRTVTPDASLSIVWHPAVMQPASWLPWLTYAPETKQVLHYSIYLVRGMHTDGLLQLLDGWGSPGAHQPSILILILQYEEQLLATQQLLQAHPCSRPIRLSAWQRLTAGICGATWLDEQGRMCSLHLTEVESVVGCPQNEAHATDAHHVRSCSSNANLG